MLSTIFKAYDIRGIYPDPLSETESWLIGCATGLYLKDQIAGQNVPLPRTVVVSRDMRPSGDSLAAALIEGLAAAEMNVIDLGLCDTSMIYFAVNHLGTAGGVQTTASHNPLDYNGFKISGPEARPIGAGTGLGEIQAIAETLTHSKSNTAAGHIESLDIWDAYRKHILRFFSPPFDGRKPIRVAIDASNGMAGKMIPAVFENCPEIEILPLNFEYGPQVRFAHEPNPLIAANMIPTQQAVIAHNADLGACFDGDADRCMITDELGNIIGCDHLTALLAEHFLAPGRTGIADAQPGSNTVVYDLRSSRVVKETIERLGATPQRCRVGHVFMKAALRKSRGVLGGELSGHFYFRDNFFADSGAITLASVLTILGCTKQKMSQLIMPLQQYPQSGERNFQVDDKQAVLEKLREKFSHADVDELDGITIDRWHSDTKGEVGGFWFNVRASNTEPLLRFNAEATDQTTLDDLLENVLPILGHPIAGH